MPIEQYREMALVLMVSIAAVNDLTTRLIPNRLLLAGLASALLLHAMSAEPGASLLSAFGGMGVGLAMFLPFYVVRGMAAGDVKMMAAVGAFTGPNDAMQIAVLTWCVGGVMALVLVLLRGRLQQALGNIGRLVFGAISPEARAAAAAAPHSTGSLPYGVAIAVGTVMVLVRHYG
jgi:prepilin peptidase CpaA